MNTNFKFYLLTCAICILLFITILAPYIVPFDPYEQNLANTLQAPNAIHLLGTDKYGRDIFSRILIGAQTTIFSSLFLVIISSVFGSLIGVICGEINSAAKVTKTKGGTKWFCPALHLSALNFQFTKLLRS